MSRDEWVTLPDGTRLHRSLDGRRYYEAAGKVWVGMPSRDDAYGYSLSLAEFEALLFGQPERDAYTRAAVALAEVYAARTNAKEPWIVTRHEQAASGAFLRLYREKHGG